MLKYHRFGLSMLETIKKVLIYPAVLFSWAKTAGWRAALTWAVYRTKKALGFQAPPSLKIKPHRAKYPVTVRMGGSSDMDVFFQIFRSDEYACLRDIPSPSLILDLGANVGYSSAYLLSCFPTATIVAVEPDPGNFDLCRKNLAPYGNRAQVVLGAVWSRRCRLVLSPGIDGREWARQVHESESKDANATVEGWDVPSLMQLVGGKSIDLLKVDIERSELELFGINSSSWLPQVKNICIELHGADCRDVFLGALKGFDYELGSSGELTICRNLQARPVSV